MDISRPRYMLVVAFLWSIGANFDKIGIRNSSPLFWAVAMNAIVSLILFPLVIRRSGKSAQKQIFYNIKFLTPIGLFGASSLFFQMAAFKTTLVAYVVAIKRTSTVIGVFFGYLFFKEKGIKERLAGAIIMLIGVLFIGLS